jgi:prolyl-tRNA synthetase
MNTVGGQEISLPLISPKDLWIETGRWDIYGKELFKLKDRKDAEFCLAPTAEESITDLVRKDIRSYKQLPLMLYQFGMKFRDEIRPRFGIMRSREFLMKDAYSFHKDEYDLEKYYKVMFEAYANICAKCGLKFRAVKAASGVIGGTLSHEFMVLADTGEEEIVWCDCGYGASDEKVVRGDVCPECKKALLKFSKGIEIGHAFKLGTKYSKSMNATYLDTNGKENFIAMGCYGIGVARMLAAIVEQSNDDNGIIWPDSVTPFEVAIVAINYADAKTSKVTQEIYRELSSKGLDVLVDDRDERAGVKFKDIDLIGIPYRITIGEKNLAEGNVELKSRKDNAKAAKLLNPKKAISEILKVFKKL